MIISIRIKSEHLQINGVSLLFNLIGIYKRRRFCVLTVLINKYFVNNTNLKDLIDRLSIFYKYTL